MGLDSWEQAVLKKWKRMKNLYVFVDRELQRINHSCFSGNLELPQVSLKRMKFSKSLEWGYFGANYRPPKNGDPACIGIFPILLLNKKDIVTGLAHEMVHHWEFLTVDGNGFHGYPEELDQVIMKKFPFSWLEENWRQTHSDRFLAKSHEVARRLEIPIADFLFK